MDKKNYSLNNALIKIIIMCPVCSHISSVSWWIYRYNQAVDIALERSNELKKDFVCLFISRLFPSAGLSCLLVLFQHDLHISL